MTGSGRTTGRWIRRFDPAVVDAVCVVCFPHAGGSATFYLPLSKALSPGLEVLAVQYPGRQDRRAEPCIDTVPDLADQVFSQLEQLIDRPLVFFGHSMGAVVAFEVARRLEEAHGVVLRRLYASGRRAPSRYREESVHLGTDDDLIAEVARLSGTGPDLLAELELVRLTLPALRADYRATETYRPVDICTLKAPITVLSGDADPLVTAEEAAAWSAHTAADCDLRFFPGGHFFVTTQLRDISRLIRYQVGGEC